MRRVTDAQVRKLMEEMNTHGRVGHAAMKAGMDRKTARKYIAASKMPSEMAQPRTWRTREDPFADDWPELENVLTQEPNIEAKTLFEELVAKFPGRYHEGQLRTLQRKIRRWRATKGPEQDVKLAQRHRPGEALQADFTSTGELGVTIQGTAFVHLLCMVVLPYSNWRWATVCMSESIASLRKGLQRALFQLGKVPKYSQTDNSTGATCRIAEADKAKHPGKARVFNQDYLALMDHYGMIPRTTAVGAKEQNGDVEAANGATKRSLEQALLVRGNRDFESIEAWQLFVDECQRKANLRRGGRIEEELQVMRELPASKLPEFVEQHVPVSEWSTIRVKRSAYSVPSRLINREVRVRRYEDRIEVFFGDALQLSCERAVGRTNRIDYRHVIGSLIRKPAGFARYVYREEMFPSLVFRRAFDRIQEVEQSVTQDLEYLRILHLAATTSEAKVEEVLSTMLADDVVPTCEAVKSLVCEPEPATIPTLATFSVDLESYDTLIVEAA